MKAAIPLFALGLLALAACAVNVPEPTRVDAKGDERVLADLRTGRTLYIDKCSGCHALFSVERFADQEWKKHIQEMIDLKKVRLQARDRATLELYLTSLNARD